MGEFGGLEVEKDCGVCFGFWGCKWFVLLLFGVQSAWHPVPAPRTGKFVHGEMPSSREGRCPSRALPIGKPCRRFPKPFGELVLEGARFGQPMPRCVCFAQRPWFPHCVWPCSSRMRLGVPGVESDLRQFCLQIVDIM